MEAIFKMIEFLVTYGKLELSNIPPDYKAFLKGKELKAVPVISYLRGKPHHIYIRELYFSKEEGNLTLYIKVPELYPVKPNYREYILTELSLETLPKLCHYYHYNVTQEMRDLFLNELLGSLQNKYIINNYQPLIEELWDFYLPTKYNECPLSLRITEDVNWEASYLTSDPKQPEFKKVAYMLDDAILGLQSKIILNDFSKLLPQEVEQLQTLLEENNH